MMEGSEVDGCECFRANDFLQSWQIGRAGGFMKRRTIRCMTKHQQTKGMQGITSG